jgi:hypothetical protein
MESNDVTTKAKSIFISQVDFVTAVTHSCNSFIEHPHSFANQQTARQTKAILIWHAGCGLLLDVMQ